MTKCERCNYKEATINNEFRCVVCNRLLLEEIAYYLEMGIDVSEVTGTV